MWKNRCASCWENQQPMKKVKNVYKDFTWYWAVWFLKKSIFGKLKKKSYPNSPPLPVCPSIEMWLCISTHQDMEYFLSSPLELSWLCDLVNRSKSDHIPIPSPGLERPCSFSQALLESLQWHQKNLRPLAGWQLTKLSHPSQDPPRPASSPQWLWTQDRGLLISKSLT